MSPPEGDDPPTAKEPEGTAAADRAARRILMWSVVVAMAWGGLLWLKLPR